MPPRSPRTPIALVLALVLASAAFAAPAPSAAVAHRVLPNGLEVFAVENHAVPLATICVVFRGGAYAHEPGTAGLFHLYEHMLFAGNEKYPTQAAFTAAMNRMGVPEWNGSTGTEHINYYVTVPSEKLEEGIEFWSWAVRKPVFDPATLENEKDVVVNEIRGYQVDPAQIMENAFETRLYPEFPWRKNIDGPEATILGATVADLEAMRATWYTPSNTAIMIGGDIDPERAFKLVERWFGDWKGAPRPTAGEPPHGPFPRGIRLLYEDESYYEGVAGVQYRWRGPDVQRQTQDTYAADVLLFLLSSPVGAFKTALMEKGPGLYDPEYIDFSYPTARDGGTFSFQSFLVLDPAMPGSAVDRAEELRAVLLAEFEAIARDPAAYFGAGELAKAKAKLIDQNILAAEVASSFVTGTLTFWWSVASTDYFFDYEANCSKVGWPEVSALVRRWLTGPGGGAEAPPVATALRMSASDAAADASLATRAAALGYSPVDPATAFWWRK